MSSLPYELENLIASGPMAHLITIDPDGSPQATVSWTGLEAAQPVSARMVRYAKPRNIARGPRIVLSFGAPPRGG